jgi:hypothetical protein
MAVPTISGVIGFCGRSNVPSAESRLVIEEIEGMEAGVELRLLARGGCKADGGNAELRGEVALPRRPRHGGK